MRAILLFATLVVCNNVYGIYVKTMFKGEPDPENTCCIELAHLYFTNNHQYIAMGTSFASLDAKLCCENQLNEVKIDSTTISQFQLDSLEKVNAFNKSAAFKQSVGQAMLKYRLTLEGKKGKIEVTQNPVSGKLILHFTASEAGTMRLSVEPVNNNNVFYDDVEVTAGKNEIEINYVPYVADAHRDPFMTYLIVLLNENEMLGVTYQHKFR
jgi:hypothetical protein